MDILYVCYLGKCVLQTAVAVRTGLVIANQCRTCYSLYDRFARRRKEYVLFCGEEDDFVIVTT